MKRILLALALAMGTMGVITPPAHATTYWYRVTPYLVYVYQWVPAGPGTGLWVLVSVYPNIGD